MKRRVVLQGIGGAALAAPFLSSCVVESGSASDEPLGRLRPRSSAAPEDAPRRLVIFHTCAGCLTNRWFPTVEDGPIDASSLATTTLAPLAPFASKLLFPRGLAMYPRGQITVNGASYYDPHDQAMGSMLTAAPIDPGGDHFALGRSLDHVAAELVNPAGNGPLVLSVGRPFASVKAVISYRGARDPYLPENDPTVVYAGLTGIQLGSAQPTAAEYRIARGESIIDLVGDDLATLRRLDMSRRDQRRISDWLELLRDTELRLPNVCGSRAAELGITESAFATSSGTDTATVFTLGADMMMKLIALTMICDANRSIILQWSGFVTFNWDGISHEHDHQALSHRNGSAAVGGTCIDGALGMIREIDEWYAGRYAQLVGLLDGIAEGERTLLDNSAVVWLPELADGSVHNVNNLPIVIAGSAGGYLRQGVSVNLEGAPLGTGNSEADCVDGEIGFETGSSGGQVPLNKLHVTLLNALGATNGGAPIETFGQVDSNEIEAGITDPGELGALLA